jgi:tRNA-2-methylthio-N6-dimethylallyladenosine synthase
MPQKKVYIETLGCQMNLADTERMLGMLDEIDYVATDIREEADLSILNSCSIREHAVDKMRSYIGLWDKKRKPGSLIALAGCVAQQEGASITQIAPGADIVIGTHNIHRLPDLVLQAQMNQAKDIHERVIEIWEELPEDIPEVPILRKNKYHAWVNIIYGCNYRCTYCIVPKTRGDQRSRSIAEIKREIETLALEGFKEIMLLGQNVDGYGLDIGSSLATLLKEIHTVDGIERIKFLTSHPCDMTYELIETVAALPKVAKYFHIPIQAGNDEVLKRMARRYTYARYMELISYIRKLMPQASITGDIIVGFPGETHEQFMDSVKAVREIRYDACITAVYSPRPYTPAADWDDPISAEEKNERIRLLNAVSAEVAEEQSKRYLGTSQQVLVEGLSQRNPRRLAGRIFDNKTTNIDVPGISDLEAAPGESEAELSLRIAAQLEPYFGKTFEVKITKAHAWALRGELINSPVIAQNKEIKKSLAF